MFNSQLENSDTGDRDVNNIATLPSLNPSATKNQRNIHSGSFGSGSSSCSSASSASSLSTGGVTAYSSASTMRGHRDKYSSSGRALNTASNMNSVKKRNSNATDYIPSTNGHSDTAGYISENGPAENALKCLKWPFSKKHFWKMLPAKNASQTIFDNFWKAFFKMVVMIILQFWSILSRPFTAPISHFSRRCVVTPNVARRSAQRAGRVRRLPRLRRAPADAEDFEALAGAAYLHPPQGPSVKKSSKKPRNKTP